MPSKAKESSTTYYPIVSVTCTKVGVTELDMKVTVSRLQRQNYGLNIYYYPSANENDKVMDMQNFTPSTSDPMEFTKHITGLLPDTSYTVFASLIDPQGRINRGVKIQTTLPVQTNFRYTNISSSVVAVEFSTLTALEYDTTLKLSYKRSTDASFRLSATKTVEANGTKAIPYFFTGLMPNIEYSFMAELCKDDKVIKTALITERTTDYSGQIRDALPFPDEYMAVPNTSKAFVRAKFNRTPKWNEGDIELHLFWYDGNDYVERFQFLDIFGDDIVGLVTEATGDQYHLYKLGLVNAQDSQDRFNMTRPFTIDFPKYTWANKVAGQPLVVSAEDVKNMADSLIKAHEYQVAVVKYHEYQYHHERRQNALESLKAMLPEIASGRDISAKIVNAVDLLALTFVETSATAIVSRYNAIKEAQGEVIDASDINDMKNLVVDALATI